ncbi:MAG: hypothetical protein ABR875_03045 [Minisyncoccia bacterium]
MNNDIIKIIEAGIFAPSGDNSQPWRFEVENNQIDIFNLPEKDNPVLNYRQRGSYIAHGCLIENILIASSNYGYAVKLKLFPKSGLFDHIASLNLEKTISQKDSLFEFIFSRCTNRKKYRSSKLEKDIYNELISIPSVMNLGNKYEIRLTDNDNSKKQIGKAAASIEQVILEDEHLHHLLFHDIIWTEKDELLKKSGLYVKTMEFSPPQRLAFRLASFWPLMKFFKVLGLPKLIVSEDSKLYSTGAVLGIILMDGHSDENFINAGRIFQRVWLTATKNRLSLQPVTALLFAAQRILTEGSGTFCQKHEIIIDKNYNEFRKLFSVDSENIAIHFRIGYADQPSSHSSKRPPNVLYK